MTMKPMWPIIGMVVALDTGIVMLALIYPFIGYVIFGIIFVFGVVAFFYPK